MLEKLLHNIASTHTLLIVDDDIVDGFPLLLSFIKGYSKFVASVHCCLYENALRKIQELPVFCNPKVKIHDLFTDSFGWDQEQTKDSEFEQLIDTTDDAVLVVDSLSFLLQNSTSQECAWKLRSLKLHKGIRCVVILLHSHLHSSKQVQTISSFADTALKLSSKSEINCKDKDSVSCEITHKKQNGKVLISNENFAVDPKTFDVTVCQDNPSRNKTASMPESPALIDSNLTFNLTLSEQEELQRKSLVLPYTRNQPVEGRIFFEPDEADLYEDDPDEDLDY